MLIVDQAGSWTFAPQANSPGNIVGDEDSKMSCVPEIVQLRLIESQNLLVQL